METAEIRVVRLFNEAINNHDIEALSSLMTSDHKFIDPGGGVTIGQETMKEGWKGFFQMFPDYRNEIHEFLQNGCTVMAHGRAFGTYNGKHGPVPENKITMPAAWRAVVQDGLICQWQVFADWSEAGKTIEENERANQ